MPTTYLEVGIERIQSHLARSRRLWARRGASEEMVRLTFTTAMAEEHGIPLDQLLINGLNAPTRVHDAALAKDGVIHLESPNEAEGLAEARRLATTIRRRLPAAAVLLRWTTLSDGVLYESVIDDLHQEEWKEERYLPAPTEYPGARLCDECQLGVAEHRINQDRLCADCAQRRGHLNTGDPRGAWRQRTVRKRIKDHPVGFAAEWWLMDQCDVMAAVPDLTALASMGPLPSAAPRLRRRAENGNHTALIFADGNGVGALFREALRRVADTATREAASAHLSHGPAWQGGDSLDLGEVKKLSAHITGATFEALMEGTSAIRADSEDTLPVVPHINGGDDVLISVTAPRAWRFLLKYLGTLRDETNRSTEAGSPRASAEKLGVEPFTMSAAMVICHHDYPFANQVDLAEEMLRRAKSAVHGNGWSLTWADVTHDGPRADAHGVWNLDDLLSLEPLLDNLAGDTAANLIQGISGCLIDPDAGVAAQRLTHRASRLPDVRQVLDAAGIPAQPTREDLTRLADLLSVQRWW